MRRKSKIENREGVLTFADAEEEQPEKQLISCVCQSTAYHEQLNGLAPLCFLSQRKCTFRTSIDNAQIYSVFKY